MMSIRLMRMGAKRRPFYRIVVMDARRPRESKYRETLGYYNPLKEPAEIKLDLDRLSYWLDRGAQASETVQSLIKKVAKRSNHSNNNKT